MRTDERPVAAEVVDRCHPAAIPRLVISTACLSGTLEDKLAAAAAARFDGIEIFEQDLIASPWSPAGCGRSAPGGASPSRHTSRFVTSRRSRPTLFAANLRRAERKFDGARAARRRDDGGLFSCRRTRSTTTSSPPSSCAPWPAARRQRGLRIAYEALAWGRFVTPTPTRGGSCGSPGIPPSACAWTASTSCPRATTRPALRSCRARRCSTCSWRMRRGSNMDVVEWSRHHRLFPGLGSFDLAGFVGHVLTTGYEGRSRSRCSTTCTARPIPGTPRSTDAVAARAAGGRRGTSTAGRQRSGLRVAFAPRLGGHAFTELAVDDVSGPVVARALTALGFVHSDSTGPSRCSSGNRAVPACSELRAPSGRCRAGTAAICALGLESADPSASARAGRRLLAPVLPRLREPEEADLSSVAAPDGTAVFFCVRAPTPTAGSRTSPRPGAPRAATPGDRDRPRVAHGVGRRLRRGRALLPLRARPGADRDRRALRAVRPDPKPGRDGCDRLVRDHPQHGAAAPRRLGAGRFPARSTSRSPATMRSRARRAMRAAGLELLKIPDNYYDDLDARLRTASPSGSRRMRESVDPLRP